MCHRWQTLRGCPNTVNRDKRMGSTHQTTTGNKQAWHRGRGTSEKGAPEPQCETFQRCKNFTLSEKKLILWSKRIVMHGDIDQPNAIMTRQIKVQKIAFEISKSGEQDKTKSDSQKLKKGLSSK